MPWGILLVDFKREILREWPGREKRKKTRKKPRIHNFFAQFEVVTIHAIVEGVKGRVDYIRRIDVIKNRE